MKQTIAILTIIYIIVIEEPNITKKMLVFSSDYVATVETTLNVHKKILNSKNFYYENHTTNTNNINEEIISKNLENNTMVSTNSNNGPNNSLHLPNHLHQYHHQQLNYNKYHLQYEHNNKNLITSNYNYTKQWKHYSNHRPTNINDSSNAGFDSNNSANQNNNNNNKNNNNNNYNNNNNMLDNNETVHFHPNNNINLAKCPKCNNIDNKVHVTQEQLNDLRIDFVKRQILQKLRLKDAPKISVVNYLPEPIITQMEFNNIKSKEDLDDYYARTSKKFIILEREYKECAFINKNPAICFSFKIDDVDSNNIDVNQAVLWVYNKPNKNDHMKQTLVVSEFEQQISSMYLPKIKPIAIKSVDVVEGWIKIDIAWPIKKWVGTHELSHLIHITCNTCELDSKDGGVIALEKEYQPFIVIDTQYRKQRSRQKRSVNCSAGIKECCREKLYISFKEIGWGDWIISPTGYNAYFCRGSCDSVASIASSNNHHSLIIKTLKEKFDRPLELIPCCTAKQFSQLELLFRDSNNTITQKFLPNMIVESCGCM